MNPPLLIIRIAAITNMIVMTYVAPWDGRMTVHAKCNIKDGWTFGGWVNFPVAAGTNEVTFPKPPCGLTAFFKLQLTK